MKKFKNKLMWKIIKKLKKKLILWLISIILIWKKGLKKEKYSSKKVKFIIIKLFLNHEVNGNRS